MERSSLNQIVRFFLRLILIISLILIFDHGIGMILKHFYFRQKYGERSQTIYAIDSTFADILIFGSSRAILGYVPEVFESKLPYTCYNTGSFGNYILYSYAIFKSITTRYNPKLIIFDITPSSLEYDPVEYERLSILLPYYQNYPEIRRVIDLRGPLEKFKRISAIYTYNSLIFQIVIGNLELSKARVPNSKGYIPVYKTLKDEKIDTLHNSNFTVDENKICAMKDIISTCNQKNIDLVFVYSPTRQINSDSHYNTIISELCTENGISYLDMSTDTTFINNHNYFADKTHLNNKGARVFSTKLINIIWRNK